MGLKRLGSREHGSQKPKSRKAIEFGEHSKCDQGVAKIHQFREQGAKGLYSKRGASGSMQSSNYVTVAVQCNAFKMNWD